MQPIAESCTPEDALHTRRMLVKVYAIKSNTTEHVYVGQTTDLRRRLEQHNAGEVKSTKSGLPWLLVASEEFPNRSSARWKEFTLKHSRGARINWIAKHGTL